jgi:hypothetical protein
MTIQTIEDDKCWVCNRKFDEQHKMTMHHTLPKHMFPKNNVVIPVCWECHQKINKHDDRGGYLLGVKINKTMKGVKDMVGAWLYRMNTQKHNNKK